MKKIAFVTGATSQDSSYLFEVLLSHGYKIYGMIRRSSSKNLWRIEHLLKDIELVYGDITDQSSLDSLIEKIRPDEVYNLAAQSFYNYSFEAPISTCDITGLGTLRILESVRRYSPLSRVFQASSSEMFGKIKETPQNESTAFYPRSPYGAAKAFAHHVAVNYREHYKIRISCGIMFNHESPRRGLEFVTRKITDGVARVKYGLERTIKLGNLEAERDFGYAGDYMKAAWMILQKDTPSDYVIATGRTHSVYEFLEEACKLADLNPKDIYEVDERFLRPVEQDHLRGNISKINKEIGWLPEVDFKKIVKLMYEADCERMRAICNSNSKKHSRS